MARKKHILLIANIGHSMWNFRRDVIADMVARGYDVTCMTGHDDYAEKVREVGAHYIPIPLKRSGLNPFRELLLILTFLKAIVTIRPAFIITYTIKPSSYAPPLARLFGIPCLSILTGLGYAFMKENAVACIARNLLRTGLKFSSHIWFLNDADREAVCGTSRLLKQKSSILPGEGVDVVKFDDALFPQPPQGQFSFLMAARLLRDKGIVEFAEASKIIVEKYPSVECRVLGAIDEDNPTGLSAAEWGGMVKRCHLTYLGTMPDVRPAIAAASVCVLPSYREGVPFALLEGGAMRRPLIATDVAGCNSVVRDGINGFLVPVQSVKGLVEAMERMINMEAQSFSDMKEAARKDIVERFRKDRIIGYYQDIIARFVK